MIGPGDGPQTLKGTRSGRLDVDLLPGVTMSVRWSPPEVLVDEEVRRGRDAEMHRLLMDMEDVAMRQRMLVERLRHTLGMNERHQSAPQSKKKRPGKT